VISILMPAILFLTVIATVSLGVFAAYAAVIVILNAFGRTSQQSAESGRTRLMLVPSQNHSSGD